MILLDNRFENEKSNAWDSDILGADQWLWLDLALKRGKARGVQATLIGAGVQMIVDRPFAPPIEGFYEYNKHRLFDALRNNKMENVLLLSGDIHLGQIYEAECSGFTGQTVLPEVTSSGLSHVQSDLLPHPVHTFRTLTLQDQEASPIFMAKNYGLIAVGGEGEVLAQVSVRGEDGKEGLRKDYTRE